MASDLYINGIVEPTDEFKKKYTAYKACERAGVEPPDELQEYFRYEAPNPSGLEVEIKPSLVKTDKYGAVKEINLKKLRSDISKIQIFMA